jgi:hypothetical protein
MKKITYLVIFIFSSFILNSCEEEAREPIHFISFEAADFNFGVELEGSTSLELKVFSANLSSSDRTFEISIATSSTLHAESYSVATVVTIPANKNVGLIPITISDTNISEGGETLILQFVSSKGVYTGEDMILNVKQVCPFNELQLNITFDDWAEETWWELLDSNGDVLVFSEEGDYAGEAEFSKTFCLPNGSYTFSIFDAFGDGTGDYQLIGSETILASGGGFEYEDVTSFDLLK